jgi:hypothetical protein
MTRRITPLDELYAIQQRDPDGGEVEPTEEDYRQFRVWIVANYGIDAMHDYLDGNWAPEPEV